MFCFIFLSLSLYFNLCVWDFCWFTAIFKNITLKIKINAARTKQRGNEAEPNWIKENMVELRYFPEILSLYQE